MDATRDRHDGYGDDNLSQNNLSPARPQFYSNPRRSLYNMIAYPDPNYKPTIQKGYTILKHTEEIKDSDVKETESKFKDTNKENEGRHLKKKHQITKKTHMMFGQRQVVSKTGLTETLNEDLNAEQREVLSQAGKNANLKSEHYHALALQKLEEIGIPSNERSQVLETMKEFIQDSHPSLNFNAANVDNAKRWLQRDGLEKIWDAPQGHFEKGVTDKRNDVEVKMHGYKQHPYNDDKAAEMRPIYMGINVGDAVCGAAPQYGRSYFVGKKHIVNKGTLSGGDTFNKAFKEGGYAVTTTNFLDSVIAQLSTESVKQILEMSLGKRAVSELSGNQYIELQVFNLTWRNMEKLVIDRAEVPEGSDIETIWEELATKKGFAIEYYNSKDFMQEAWKNGLAAANKNQAPLPKSALSKQSAAPSIPLDAPPPIPNDAPPPIPVDASQNTPKALKVRALPSLPSTLPLKYIPDVDLSKPPSDLPPLFPGDQSPTPTTQSITPPLPVGAPPLLPGGLSQNGLQEADEKLDQLLNNLHLITWPGDKSTAAFGFRDMRDLTVQLSNSVDNAQAKPIKPGGVLASFFQTQQPYFQQLSSKYLSFSQKYENQFKTFLNSLKSMDDLQNVCIQNEREFAFYQPSKQELKQYESAVDKIRQEIAFKELNPTSLYNLMFTPVEHIRMYLNEFGELSDALSKTVNKGDDTHFAQIAREIADNEEKHMHKLESLAWLLTNESFKNSLDPKDRLICGQTAALITSMIFEGRAVVKLFDEIATSMATFPGEWVEVLKQRQSSM